MGADDSRPVKPLERLDIEITAENVYQHLNLARDRKINELATRERELRDKMKKKSMAYEDVCLELISIVNLFKYIKASKIVMRYCQLIKEHSMQIVECCKTRNFKPIRELVPYFEGIVWSSDKLNLKYVKEFNSLFYTHFGPEVYNTMKSSKFVDQELRECFETIEPTPKEINDYLQGFIKRHGVPMNIPNYSGSHGNPSGGYAQPRVDDGNYMPPMAQPVRSAQPPAQGYPTNPVAPVAPAVDPNDEFNDMINQLKDPDFTPSVVPKNETQNMAAPYGGQPAPFGAQATPFSAQATPFSGQAQPAPSTSNYAPPPVQPQADPMRPKRAFDKVTRIKPVAREVFTEENDECAEDFNMDEIPLAVRIRELRENKV